MSVWVCVPSARPVAEVNAWGDKWRAMGYKTFVFRDKYDPALRSDAQAFGDYRGYAETVNMLVKLVLANHPDCDWIVIGGDDVFPDPTKRADEIARECSAHFYDLARDSVLNINIFDGHLRAMRDHSFGVVQPTGDRWGAEEPWARERFPDAPAYIDRVAGSAWIGREFAQRAYGGNGPLWHDYVHMFCDEELQCVAEKLGVFWQRRDLAQHHAHWGRDGFTHAAPAFLQEANSGGHWAKYEALFRERKAAGFPGSEVL